MSRPAYRTPPEDRLRARLLRREALDRLTAEGRIRVTVAPADPRAPVTDRDTHYPRRTP